MSAENPPIPPQRPASAPLQDDLKELEQRLRALKQQVSEHGAAGEGAQPPAPEVATPARETQGEAGSSGPPLPRPLPEPPGAAGVPARPAAPQPAAGTAPEPDDVVARAEAQASTIIDEAHAQVAELKRRIQSLIELRDYLERSARDVVAYFQDAIGESEASTYHSAAPHAEDAPAAQTVPSAGAPPHSALPAVGESFEGVVTVVAGPFARIEDVGGFQTVLRELPAATRAQLIGLDGVSARFEVELSRPIPLAAEIERRAMHGVAVISASTTRLVLRFHGGPGSPAETGN